MAGHPSLMQISRQNFAVSALMYAVLILYVSTVLGPLGFNFTPITAHEALGRFLRQATVWVDHGSDQRADWLGNLFMLAPFGFLVAGGLTRHGSPRISIGRMVASVGICVIFVVGVKFIQIYFPPRTVTLNYVVAQTVGALVGVLLCPAWQSAVAGLARHRIAPRATLILLLRVYTAALILFILLPLDVALNLDDLADQMRRLPDAFVAVPGEGRPIIVRVVVMVAGTLAAVPVGVLLALRLGSAPGAILGRGLGLMLAVFGASTLVMGATPSFVSVLYRTLGVGLGAALFGWFSRQDLAVMRGQIARCAPWFVLPYLGLLLAVNGLLSPHWRAPEEAWAAIGPRSLLPFYNYYIVGKAEAARNVLAHAIMYAPIGLLTWACRRPASLAVSLAAILALLVEGARYLRPGLQGELNTVLVGAGAAWLVARGMPIAWNLLRDMGSPATSPVIVPPQPRPVAVISAAARPAGPVPGWRERAAGFGATPAPSSASRHVRPMGHRPPAGDSDGIEHL